MRPATGALVRIRSLECAQVEPGEERSRAVFVEKRVRYTSLRPRDGRERAGRHAFTGAVARIGRRAERGEKGCPRRQPIPNRGHRAGDGVGSAVKERVRAERGIEAAAQGYCFLVSSAYEPQPRFRSEARCGRSQALGVLLEGIDPSPGSEQNREVAPVPDS